MPDYSALIKKPGAADALPVTLADARTRLRLDDTISDDELTAYLKSAANHIERVYGYTVYNNNEYELRLEKFPTGAIEIPLRPIISTPTVRYRVSAIGYENLSSFQFYDGFLPSLHAQPPGSGWPQTYGSAQDVIVTFSAGHGFNNVTPGVVPAQVITALLLLAGHWIENRQAATDRNLTAIPFGVDAIMSTFKILDCP